MSTSKRHTNAKNIRGKFNVQDESIYRIHHTDEEASAEFIDSSVYSRNQTESNGTTTSKVSSFGIIALALSIASLFFLPVILGALGIIVGIFATRANSRVMGIAAIVIGVFSVFAGLLVYPFF